MPRLIAKPLTDLAIKSKPPGLHGDRGNPGLCLSVKRSSDGGLWRSWVFRYTVDGKTHYMGLGPYPDVPLAKARELATRAREAKRDGLDPLAVRRAERAAARARGVSFKDVAEEYITTHQGRWKDGGKTGDQWRASLRDYAYPVFGDLPVGDVALSHVEQALKPIWETKAETARRVRSRIENILAYAAARELRSGDNPARWRGGPLKELLANKPRRIVNHARLHYDDIPGFLQELRARPGTSARTMELIVLSATRTREALHARWDEFDFDKAVWTIPAERMKSGRAHRVPLPDAAVRLLLEQRKVTRGELVFPREGTKDAPMSSNALLALLKRMGRTGVTTHGMRSSFRDWAAERTNFPREVAERQLAHGPRDKTEAAYQRADLLEKRRPLMTAWASFCQGGKVVPFQQKRADRG